MSFDLIPAMLGGMVLVPLLLFLLNPFAKHVRLIDHPDGDRKLHEGQVPLTGGIVLFLALAIVLPAAGLTETPLTRDDSFWTVTTIVLSLVVVIHAVDDVIEMRAVSRLTIDALLAFVLWSYAYVRLSSLGDLLGMGEIVIGRSAIVMTIFCFVAASNAFNWVDGIDGLCIGLGIICFATLFALIMLGNGTVNTELVSIVLLFTAVLIPFYFANLGAFGQKLTAYLGDSGARLIGFSAAIALILAAAQGMIHPVLAYFALAVPVCDCLALMGQRMAQGRSPMSADRLHIHHLLTDSGLSPARARQWILVSALVMSAFGVAFQLVAPPEWVISLFVVASFAGFIVFRLWLQRRIRLASAGTTV